jgi:hypothetical protein
MQHEIKQCNHLPTYYYCITPLYSSIKVTRTIIPDDIRKYTLMKKDLVFVQAKEEHLELKNHNFVR